MSKYDLGLDIRMMKVTLRVTRYSWPLSSCVASDSAISLDLDIMLKRLEVHMQ